MQTLFCPSSFYIAIFLFSSSLNLSTVFFCSFDPLFPSAFPTRWFSFSHPTAIHRPKTLSVVCLPCGRSVASSSTFWSSFLQLAASSANELAFRGKQESSKRNKRISSCSFIKASLVYGIATPDYCRMKLFFYKQLSSLSSCGFKSCPELSFHSALMKPSRVDCRNKMVCIR